MVVHSVMALEALGCPRAGTCITVAADHSLFAVLLWEIKFKCAVRY